MEEGGGRLAKLFPSKYTIKKYLEEGNAYFPLLKPQLQREIVKRIKMSQKAFIKTQSGEERTIIEYVEYVLSHFDLKDRLEHIIIFGSSIYSPEPSDVDFKIGLRINAREMVDYQKKVEHMTAFINSQSPILVFPEKNYTPIDCEFKFLGFDPLTHEIEYLAALRFDYGVAIYGTQIRRKKIDVLTLRKEASYRAKELIDSMNIHSFFIKYDLDSVIIRDILRKSLYRLLHATLIVSEIDPNFLKQTKPRKIYNFINKYFLKKYTGTKKTELALRDIEKYYTGDKAKSILAYILIKEIELLKNSNEEQLQLEAVEKLKKLHEAGNLRALKAISLFKNVKSNLVTEKVKGYLSQKVSNRRRKAIIFEETLEAKEVLNVIQEMKNLENLDFQEKPEKNSEAGWSL